MKWLRIIVACSVLGLATTVGVAWTAALVGDSTEAVDLARHVYTAPGCPTWLVFVTRKTWNTRVFGMHFPGPDETFTTGTRTVDPTVVPDWSRASNRDAGPSFGVRGFCMDHGWGWPARAFWCGWDYVPVEPGPKPAHKITARGAILSPASRTMRNPAWYVPEHIPALPIRPIWKGIVLDSIAYGMFWFIVAWTITRAVGHVIQHGRVRRGRCPKCGYDLRGQPPEAGAGGCPECGWNRPPEPEATT